MTPQLDFENFSLEQARDVMTSGATNAEIAEGVEEAMATVASSPSAGSPLLRLLALIERIRVMPRGFGRLAAMNAFVRTLGDPRRLASMLDLLRSARSSEDERDVQFARTSQRGRMHCLYGWSGQTLLLGSSPDPTHATTTPIERVDGFLGYPPARWDLSVHVWQPNPEAEPFDAPVQLEPNVIAEPPHSHPFDFVSYVSVGEMRQSIYVEVEGDAAEWGSKSSDRRYGESPLERVDGVWPPHSEKSRSYLRTIEDRVLLRESNSYFMPFHAIHDVEIDSHVAAHRPAITLFLPSEAVVKPHVFMSESMANYHDQNPSLKERGQALSPEEWDRKVRSVASYLRRESETLHLAEVMRCGSTYGFMHQRRH